MSRILNFQLHEFISSSLKFFFTSLPFFILLGPFLSDLAISLSGLLFLILLYVKKKYSFLNNKFFLCFLFFYFYLLLLSIFSSNPLASLESSLFYFRFGLYVLVIKYLIIEDSIILKKFTLNLSISIFVALLYGYIYYLSDMNSILFDSIYSRIPLPFTNEYILGSFLARIFPLFFCLYLFYYGTSKQQIWFLSIITILTDILIYISGERTAFALITISILLLIFCLPKFRYIRVMTLIISIIAISAITIFSSTVKERMISSTLEGINYKDASKQEIIKDASKQEIIEENQGLIFNKYYFFSDAHNALANSATSIFLDNNKLFGIGPKLFRHYCVKQEYMDRFGYNSCSTHPHYTFLQILVETGVIGFVIILMLLLYVTVKIIKHMYRISFRKPYLSIIELGAFISIFISLCPVVPSGNFFNNWLSSIYFLPLVFIFYFKELKLND